MLKRKVCVISGTRADYGLLLSLLRELDADTGIELQIVATGMHLSPEFGMTYREIESDGFLISQKVEMLLSSDTPVGIAKSIGLGISGFADVFSRLQPDIVVILGDRFEMLAAAQAALIAQIPIAHIFGGDTTEGAFDEAIRHSISKMAHLHFVSNEDSRRRVVQMGENPANVFNYGSTGIDIIKSIKLLTKSELEAELDLNFSKKSLLITFHPATLEKETPSQQFSELLLALDQLGPDVDFIFTKPNADTAGRSLGAMIDQFVSEHPSAHSFISLGQHRYLSLMSVVDVVVGNSSSGLLEAPSFQIPTVNIGDRQSGRLQPNSVINCRVDASQIKMSILKAFEMDCSRVKNPYGDGNSAPRILAELKSVRLDEQLIKKHFYDINI